MTTLKTTQSHFQNYLLDPDCESDIYPQIAPCSRIDPHRRLKIYFNAYRLRLMEVLEKDFPKTHILLGDDAFSNACEQYVHAHPSTHFSVRYFGQNFALFLGQNTPYSQWPFVEEMARLEWTLSQTLDAADAPLVAADVLSKFSQEQWPYLQFEFHPSLFLEEFHWDTVELFKDIDSGHSPRPPVQHSAPISWMFWRKHLSAHYQSCERPQATILKDALTGQCFYALCDQLCQYIPETQVPEYALTSLQGWLGHGFISNIAPKP